MDVARPPQKSAVPSGTPPTPRPPVPAPAAPARPVIAAPAAPRSTPPIDRPAMIASTTSAPPVAQTPTPAAPAPTHAQKPEPTHAPAQHSPQTPLTVHQAPKENTDARVDAKLSLQKTELTQSHPKPKPATGQRGPIGAIVVTVLMMLALSALAIVIYLNT